MSEEERVMPFEKAQDVFPIKVTPKWGKGAVNWETGMSHHKDQPAKQTGDGGVYVCQHLSYAVVGKACRAVPRSEPSRGNPAARDRREACGNVSMMGAGLRPSGKPLDQPPYPKMHARRTSIPTP